MKGPEKSMDPKVPEGGLWTIETDLTWTQWVGLGHLSQILDKQVATSAFAKESIYIVIFHLSFNLLTGECHERRTWWLSAECKRLSGGTW